MDLRRISSNRHLPRTPNQNIFASQRRLDIEEDSTNEPKSVFKFLRNDSLKNFAHNSFRDLVQPHRRSYKSKASSNQVDISAFRNENDLSILLGNIKDRINKVIQIITSHPGSEDTLPQKCKNYLEEIDYSIEAFIKKTTQEILRCHSDRLANESDFAKISSKLSIFNHFMSSRNLEFPNLVSKSQHWYSYFLGYQDLIMIVCTRNRPA